METLTSMRTLIKVYVFCYYIILSNQTILRSYCTS